jgi:cytochrome c-type biogenesis protein CcmH/NrfF
VIRTILGLHVIGRGLRSAGVAPKDCSDLSTDLRCSHCQSNELMCNSTIRWFNIRNCQDWRYRNGHGNEMIVRLMTVSYVAIKLDWST